jgi:hypothetical protein
MDVRSLRDPPSTPLRSVSEFSRAHAPSRLYGNESRGFDWRIGAPFSLA